SFLPLFKCLFQFVSVCANPFSARIHAIFRDGDTLGCLQNDWERLVDTEGKEFLCGSYQRRLWDIESSFTGSLDLQIFVQRKIATCTLSAREQPKVPER